MTTPLPDLTVHGTPAGQGNLRTGRHGRACHANSREVEHRCGEPIPFPARNESCGLNSELPDEPLPDEPPF